MQNGNTALMLAATSGSLKAVKLLLDLGADRDLLDDQGRKAAKIAEDNRHLTVSGYILKVVPRCKSFRIYGIYISGFHAQLYSSI
jgi:ankyrin repeat protein